MRQGLLLTLAALVLAAPAAANLKPTPKHGGALAAKLGASRVAHDTGAADTKRALVASRTVFAGTAAGTISAFSLTSITLQTERGEVTCSRTDGSPTLGDRYRVGDRVKFICTDGVLTAIARLDAPAPPEVKTGLGTLTSLSDGSLTVHTGTGDLTCTRADGSPRLGDYHVGDVVKVSCTNGVLTAIAKVATVTSVTSGVVVALSPPSLTVLSDGGERTCSRTDASPSLDGYQVGSHVKATCVNGVLTAIQHL